MKMAQAAPAWGWGLGSSARCWFSSDKAALETFIRQGYMVGADANAAAKYDDKAHRADRRLHQRRGVRYRLLPSKVNVYDLTDKGLAAQAMINGYKYWPDAALNP